MKRYLSRLSPLALLLGLWALSLAPLPVLAQDSVPQLVCGGIGEDESSRMLAEARRHALTIIFAANDGAYLTNIQTEVTGPHGTTANESTCGPIGQVDVTKAGNYKIKATYAGKTQEKSLGLKPAGGGRLVLRWQAE